MAQEGTGHSLHHYQTFIAFYGCIEDQLELAAQLKLAQTNKLSNPQLEAEVELGDRGV